MNDDPRIDLAEVQRLTDGATPGPWSAADEHGDLGPGASPAWCVSRMDADDPEKYRYDVAYMAHTSRDAMAEVDAEFIAAARELVPALAAEVELLRSRLATARADVVDASLDVLWKWAEEFDAKHVATLAHRLRAVGQTSTSSNVPTELVADLEVGADTPNPVGSNQ